MLVIGIDPVISGSICFFQDGKIIDVVEMPTIIEGKKNKKQVNGSQIYNEILERIKKIDKKEISDENIFELAIESGADECISHDEFHEVQCIMSEIYNVKKKLEKIISNFISTEIEWIALNNADVENDKQESVIEFLETLEDDDDVQNVFSNANFSGN